METNESLDLDIAEAITQLRGFAMSRADRARAKTLLREIAAGGGATETDARLAELLGLLDRGGSTDSARRRTLFGVREDDGGMLVGRLYQMVERLLGHIELITGEARDTRLFREQLREAPTAGHAAVILDQLEEMLLGVDKEVAQARERDARVLSFVQHQCEDIGDGVQHTVSVVEKVEASVGDIATGIERGERSPGLLAARLAQETEGLSRGRRELDRATDRVRIVERKVNELHSGVRNRADLALKDPLTGAYSADGFALRAAELFARWARAGSPLSAVSISLNARDAASLSPLLRAELMRRCAIELEERVRISDLIGYTAGNEFTLLLPDTNADGASAFTSRAVIALESTGFNQFGKEVALLVRAGLTEAREGDDLDAFLARSRTARISAEREEHTTHLQL